VGQKYNGTTDTGSTLNAFNASTLVPLFISATPQNPIDPAKHLTIPMVANGKVYVGTQDNLTVLGLYNKTTPNEGNGQSGVVGTKLAKPMRVVVTNAYTGAVMPNVTINFSDGGSGGSFINPSPVTNAQGVTSTTYTLPETPGTYEITATAPGFTTAYWSETATAATTKH
jgi:hypothetical protein